MADDFRTDRRRLESLVSSLRKLVERDPEQEVTGFALPVVDAVLSTVREKLPGDPVANVMREVISVETLADGEPVRAADLLVVVEQLQAILGPQPPPPPMVARRVR